MKIPNLVQIKSIGDGSCMFHSVLGATNSKYKTASRQDRIHITESLRRNLAKHLDSKYSKLSRGQLESFAEGVKGVHGTGVGDLRQMKATLDSHAFAGAEYLEHLSNELNVDIYIIDLDRGDMYMLGDLELYIKNRPSVIIGYLESRAHFDLVGQLKGTRIITVWSPDHETILALRKRIAEKRIIRTNGNRFIVPHTNERPRSVHGSKRIAQIP